MANLLRCRRWFRKELGTGERKFEGRLEARLGLVLWMILGRFKGGLKAI